MLCYLGLYRDPRNLKSPAHYLHTNFYLLFVFQRSLLVTVLIELWNIPPIVHKRSRMQRIRTRKMLI